MNSPPAQSKSQRIRSRRKPRRLFFARISLPNENGCMLWTGPYREAQKGFRYGVHGLHTAHRLAFQYWHGPIPEGHVVDHVYANGCRSTLCCAPGHLEAVTQHENIARGRKGELFTHCKQGHAMTQENTYLRKDRPGRQCRRCKANRERDRQRRIREGSAR